MKRRLLTWFRDIPRYDHRLLRGALIGMFAVSALVYAGMGIGAPSGRGPIVDALAFMLVYCAGTLLATIIAAFIMRMIRLPLPRLFVSGTACLFFSIQIPLSSYSINAKGASAVVAVALAIGLVCGVLGALFRYSRKPLPVRVLWLLPMGAIVAGTIIWLGDGIQYEAPVYEGRVIEQIEGTLAQEQDPSLQGAYEVEVYTYSNGQDRHRNAFGYDTTLLSESVDASSFTPPWSGFRKWFWGFGEQNIALNGTVWMPQGDGPFPLVLMVHGNHHMTEFSDAGYAYLGELLASRGFIAVSVDENFLNYSFWAGSYKEDMRIRAWLLQQHLAQIDRFASATDGNFFTGKVDLEAIALIGHSRGGQAAVLASMYNRFYEEALEGYEPIEQYPIRTVIGIAPVDFKLEDRYLSLRNTNYLVIHGSQDGDVNSFSGERQYKRTFLSIPGLVKSAVYIEGANHGQFNTDWGRSDITRPTSLLLNHQDTLPAQWQRKIAQTYISGFLELTLHQDRSYMPLFEDYRAGAAWLPQTGYKNRFQQGGQITLVDYEANRGLTVGSRSGVELEGEGFETWEELDVKNRLGNSTHNRAVKLNWQEAASYTVWLPPDDPIMQHTAGARLSFSVASLEEEAAPAFTVGFVMNDGREYSLPLQQLHPVGPAFRTQYTKGGWLAPTIRNGKYGSPSEPVFQTVLAPLSVYMDAYPDFVPEEIAGIRYHFEQSVQGTVFIDDIGWYNAN